MTELKRLVDLVDRGPEDDYFFPASASATLFRRTWSPYHNAVQEIVELGYQGHCAWGSRITIPLRARESGDLLQWICLRLKPRSWLGAELEGRFLDGTWNYADPSSGWMWAGGLGSVAIQKVEWEIGDAIVEQWPGEWMDVWSRRSLDLGRGPVWDADLYGSVPALQLRDSGRDAWTAVSPTEDGYVYCWLPLTFLRRPQTAFPLIAVGEHTEVRLHVTLRPFAEVVRRRAVARTGPTETPLGSVVRVVDQTGATPVPWEVRLPARVPEFEEVSVLAGVVHLEDPLRGSYLRDPFEMMYEPIVHMKFDVPDKVAVDRGGGDVVAMQCPLRELNGPVRELVFVLRRKGVWAYNEWTNYGALLEPELVETRVNAAGVHDRATGRGLLDEGVIQQPMLRRARLMVDNAIFRDEAEAWWRYETAIQLPGGVRLSGGMVYGHLIGDAARWAGDDLQPASTVNASRSLLRLDLEVEPPAAGPEACAEGESAWEVHVFAVCVNWMRFVGGVVGPLFKD
jgi:hypothetical protein